MTLDDLSPSEVELAEAACTYLPLTRTRPGRFAEHLAAHLAAYAPDLAERILELTEDDLRALYEYLLDRQAHAGALALSA